ncbi:MAG: ABC transporter permease subunit [Anaerolineae bacterium]|nr:ABC transporter permease subunit [Anaerolineae bacterium]
MNFKVITAIAQRDLLQIIRSKDVVIPMIILPVILMLLLPGLIGFLGPVMAVQYPSELDDIRTFLDRMPENIAVELQGYNELQTLIVLFINYFFAPFFLIMPLMVSSTIAANSFAGEKERKTLENLLYTPATDFELFAGKFCAAWIPALLVSFGSFIIYALTANFAAWSTMQQLFFPNFMWLILVVWVAPAAAGLGLGTMMLVSSKAQTYQGAYQTGSMVVLPVILLVLGQVSGVLYFSPGVVFIVGLVLWVIDALVLWFAVQTFQRTSIITRI